MHHFKKVGSILLFILFLSTSAKSQNTVSPYSAYGIGMISDRAYTSNIGMGKTGLAYYSPWYVSTLNPAVLSDQSLTTFEAGLGITKTAIRDEVNRFNQTSGGLSYLAIAIPILPSKLGVALSLNPYFSRNFSISETDKESSNPVPIQKLYNGSGNVSQFRLSTGYAITTSLSLGFEVNYNFGVTTNEITSQGVKYEDETIPSPYKISSETTLRYSDLSYLIGARYRHKLPNKNSIAIGATYALPASITTIKNSDLQYTSIAGDPLSGPDYTQELFNDLEGKTVIPGKIATGITYMNRNKWAISLDYSFQDWTTLEQFNESDFSLIASNELNIGAEFTPDFNDNEKYLERITYRTGFSFKNGPVIINNQPINSFGITFGLSAPISRISNLNTSFEIGQRGTLQEGLVKENYFGINLSFTYNDKWFIRRQFD